ncbi:MAG TPA: MEDS domain-containing protein, partial [Flavobacteriales bacterium]|nr:MEDS domain-containing protein [Flavobacteriales bacterium]
ITDTLMTIARGYPKLHIYGEMVALLMEAGNHRAVHMLEELWNNLGRVRPFALLCGYPRSAFATQEQVAQLARICACHTDVLADGPTPAAA